jgi:cyclopropane fatty-acyl-phospholipid synthase-like methyltransferase
MDLELHEEQTISGLKYTDEEKHLFALVTGFMRTKLIFAALEVEIFNYLSIRARTFEELLQYVHFPDRSLTVFLDCLLNLKLISVTDKNRYQNTGISSKYLVKGKLSYVGGSFQMFNSLYEECKDLKTIFSEGGASNRLYSYLFKDIDQVKRSDVEEYTKQMQETNAHPVMTLTEFYDFEDCKVVIDIGGGSGKICQTIVSQYPHLETILFDLPPVCEKAEEELEGFWLKHRIKIFPGDFFENDLPKGFDTAVLMRITQDWSMKRVRELFQKIYDSLPDGGKIIIYEPFRDEDPQRPGDASLISLLLLLNTEEGECRRKSEVMHVLQEVGFVHMKCIHTIYIYDAIVGIKP